MKTSVLTMTDFPDAVTLYRAAAQAFPGLSEEGFCDALVRNLRRGSVLGIRREGRLAGIVIFSPPLSRISFLCVHPLYRRCGIGRALMERALGSLGGCAELFTYAPDNPRAPGAAYCLSRSLGFEEAGNIPGYETAVICMRKSN